MKVRAITALFFVIVVLASIVLNGYVFTIFFVVLSSYCLNEFYRIIADETGRPNRLGGLVLGALSFGLYAAYCLGSLPVTYLLLIVPLTAAVFITSLYQKQAKPFADIAYTLLGVVYVILPFVSFFTLGFATTTAYDYRLPLGFMLILWGNDTGAYLVGRYFGRHRLFERISPKKTWEGLAGGVILALVASLVLAHYFPLLATWQWIGIALIISIFGTFGDLVESMLKRSQHVKDSGSVLPGHGGLLDRFDGLLLAAPAVVAFLKIVL
ncbi:phosphatidate cytidylyltransferase [Parapedobacter koreensis]|uniref:Phosphatidate cytidylyltransferase n=1 Tax=Parapedobacter koreensis TaxID=332977 RepID=A0A1H7QQD4_9SPHI|nr:phosphatidate cytidylyltransferase [Parapedobacter koreensis]SEL49815.1 phosphatidate cytidylyltransferase [Parapedobacter koreensis]